MDMFSSRWLEPARRQYRDGAARLRATPHRSRSRQSDCDTRPPRSAEPAPALQKRLVMMVRKPAAGRVKTRLARGIGVVAATAFYRTASAGLIARLSGDPRWRMLLAVTPDAAVGDRAWPTQVERVAQGGGDLGARLQRLFDRLPPGPVVIIGSDSPDIRPAHIAAAFAGLGRADAVLGPAPDGGYWLIGLKRSPRVLKPLARVRWSSEHTLTDTLANLTGKRVELLAPLDDIDEAADLARSRGRHARRISIPLTAN